MTNKQLGQYAVIATGIDPGRVRKNNEDCVTASPDQGLLVVADGMGGCNAGEIASQMAVDTIRRQLVPLLDALPREDNAAYETLLEKAIFAANRSIYSSARRHREWRGMGTTVVTALIHQDQLSYAYVGDSPLYHWRAGRLKRLTVDHSLAQELVELGYFKDLPETIKAGVNQNVLSRAVGIESRVRVDSHSITLLPGDGVLLCSDGLSRMLDTAMLEAILAAKLKTPDAAVKELIQSACDWGGLDNIAIALAYLPLAEETA